MHGTTPDEFAVFLTLSIAVAFLALVAALSIWLQR